MARKTSLTQRSINYISKCLKLRMKWKEIAAGLGVYPLTIRTWLAKGKADEKDYEKGKKSIYHRLYEAVEQTKANLIAEYAGVVRKALTHGTTTKTTKTRIDKDGNVFTEIIEKEIPPNAEFALKVLAIIDPAHWQAVQHIKVDWQKPLIEAGVDPRTAEQAFIQYLEENADKLDDIEIPLIPNRDV